MMNPHLNLPALQLMNEQKVILPGSKSITNRALLLAALSEGNTQLVNVLNSDDTSFMIQALKKLGVKITQNAENQLMVQGNGGHFGIQKAELFLGNAGTAVRPLSAVLSLLEGEYTILGVERMYERPIGDLTESLKSIGAQIKYLGKKYYPPLLIKRFEYNDNHEISINGNVSSQFLTSLLIALPLLKKKMTIHLHGDLISKPYIDMTLNLLKEFNIQIVNHDHRIFEIKANSRYLSNGEYFIEGDASSASYFLVAGFIAGKKINITGIKKNSIQGDIQLIAILEKMGAKVTWNENSVTLSRDRQNPIQSFDIDANHFPDAAMVLCILALAAKDTCVIRNIASWKVKETDRIVAMKNELEKLGASVEITSERIAITAGKDLNKNVSIDTYDDHRMAMCFSLISLFKTPVIIKNYHCVNKTYPEYFDHFLSITEKIA